MTAVIIVGYGFRLPEFKSWMRLFVFHLALMPLEKAWPHLFFTHLDSLALIWQPVREKGNHEFKPTVSIYLILPLWVGSVTRSVFELSITDLISEFSFFKTGCLTKAKELILHYCLLIAGEIKNRFMPFTIALTRTETETPSSSIWPSFNNSIFFRDNRYARRASVLYTVDKLILYHALLAVESLVKFILKIFWYANQSKWCSGSTILMLVPLGSSVERLFGDPVQKQPM